ncbi:hypothetical protein QYF36_002490 [Acer negundo]|nr:hypothetical protein QYF36_002490 [Acer negundo]
MATAIGEEQLQSHDDDDDDEQLQMTNDVYIQIRLLRGVLDYYQHNNLYHHDHNPNSLPDFFNNWLRDNFLAGDFRELIHNLREKFQSGEVSERKVEEKKKKKKQDQIQILAYMIEYYISEQSYPLLEFQHYKGELSSVEDDMKFLAAMIDYYIRKWRYPSEETEKIERLKTNYKKQVQKIRDKELIFLRVDGLLLFKLSEFIWGFEVPSREVDVDKKILAAMVDYYTSEWKNPLENLIDFHKNRLKMEISLSQCSETIYRMKRKYKEQQLEAASCANLQKLLIHVRILKLKNNPQIEEEVQEQQVQKKNKDLDDIQLFKLSEDFSGSKVGNGAEAPSSMEKTDLEKSHDQLI